MRIHERTYEAYSSKILEMLLVYMVTMKNKVTTGESGDCSFYPQFYHGKEFLFVCFMEICLFVSVYLFTNH